MSQMNNQTTEVRQQIVVRALILNEQNELLLVEREPSTSWSVPGGRLVNGETLKVGVRCEVYKETGLEVEVDRLVDVHKCFDAEHNQEKIEFYFRATATSNALTARWADADGQVKHAKFFKREEVQGLSAMWPTILCEELW